MKFWFVLIVGESRILFVWSFKTLDDFFPEFFSSENPVNSLKIRAQICYFWKDEIEAENKF